MRTLREPVSTTTTLDRQFRAFWARQWMSLSPHSSWLAFSDWWMHLAMSPGKLSELAEQAFDHGAALMDALQQASTSGAGHDTAALDALPPDHRFTDPDWKQWPFSFFQQAFVLSQDWWLQATHGVEGVEPHHQRLVAFWARQWLDMFSPGNQLATNPTALARTADEGGGNLLRGVQFALEEASRYWRSAPPEGAENFLPGRDVAVTPGQVVVRNRLVEVIQYAPSTGKVCPEPILIVPAWIMKYYILDLSPANSLVRHLVDRGHTVFCISWKNPGQDERDLGMDDYLELGIGEALDTVADIVPGQKIHAVGYCLGGTLLAIAAAAMARDGDDRLASLTLLTSQTDFSEPGELELFIDESQVSLLEAQMAESGYLRAEQMAGAFQMLRSYDLLWSRMVKEYLLGSRRPLNDLMAWNADSTRMPARMHSEYLRSLFLDNALAQGRYLVDGRTVSLTDLHLPIFMVATTADHVAPWRSVFKLHHLTSAELTFVLTSGGHNAGIVSEPGGRSHREYRMHTRKVGDASLSECQWQQLATRQEGSWWTPWFSWLGQHSGEPIEPPKQGAVGGGASLGPAPGQYVLRK